MGNLKHTGVSSVLWSFAIVLFISGCLSSPTVRPKTNSGKQINVETSLRNVRERIHQAEQMRSDDLKNVHPTLVAVSTGQSPDLILRAYQAGQRHFGESNVEELFSKATNKKIKKSCPEIKWHFIGPLSNKQLSKLVSVPNLYLIETVDSRRMATALEEAVVKRGVEKQLRVFVQVKIDETEPSAFVKHVIDECPHLKFSGLMIPGKNTYNTADGPNPEFLTLVKYKKSVCEKLNLSPSAVQLSMGMTKDFEKAIALGSDNVRVGTAIFGERTKKY